jgi:hypothetical protein
MAVRMPALRTGRALLPRSIILVLLEQWSRDRIPPEAWMRVFCVCDVLCVGSGLASGDPPSKEVYRITDLKKATHWWMHDRMY